MKDDLFDHINYMLFMHDCVIVPGLGAFIINCEKALYDEGYFSAPEVAITFNQDVNHNDGLLATFCQQKESLSYESACKRIRLFVAKIQADLKQGSRVVCGKIGVLYLNDNQSIAFEPNKNYIHPDYIGLSKTTLFPFTSMSEGYIPVKRGNRLAYIAAAAAIALFFAAPSFNMGEQRDGSRGQQAGLSYSLLNTTVIPKATVNTSPSVILPHTTDESNIEERKIQMPKAQGTSTRTYYIVVASETSKHRTDILTNKIKQDFPDVALLKSSERYRLYAASFDNKQVAEDYLNTFRKEYPEYKNAWLLSKRNK